MTALLIALALPVLNAAPEGKQPSGSGSPHVNAYLSAYVPSTHGVLHPAATLPATTRRVPAARPLGMGRVGRTGEFVRTAEQHAACQ